MNRIYELTDQQKNVWNSEMFYSGTNINNIGGYLLIKEKVDLKLLEKAANLYVKNNEAIRYNFSLKDTKLVQMLNEYKPFNLEKISVDNFDALNKYTTELVSKPFKVLDTNLYKFILFYLPDGRGGIITVFHHLISDAWSLSLFISEIIDIYSSLLKKVDEFSEFPSYSEYITSCEEYEKGTRFIKDKDFWNNTFNKLPELTYISKDKKVCSSNSCRKICAFDNSFFDSIVEYCKDQKCSVYTFFMAIFSIYLSKINNTSSAILGTPVLNRSNFKEKNTAGMFVSTVPFKIDIDSDLNFISFLKKVSLMQTSIFRHQRYPYTKLLQDIKEKYNISENLYDFVLSYQNARDNRNTASVDYEVNWFPTSHIAESIEAHFYDMDDTGKSNIYYYYRTDKFSEKDIELLHKRIINMAKQAINNPILKDISIITNEEQKIIDKFNNTSFEYNRNETLIDIFEKHVKASPDKKAVIFKGNFITYKELDEKSNKIANFLLNKGVCSDDTIGVMFHRSLDILPVILGILKSGAAYMLIDPSLPEDRIQYMLNDSHAKFAITDLYINYESYNLDQLKYYSNILPDLADVKNDRFCVIYTSGSTGTPKGVELRCLSVINLVNSFRKLLHTNKCRNFLCTSTVSFDMFIVENFVSILDGKTVVLADEDEQVVPAFTSKLIINNDVDFILSTPSKIALLLETPECLKNIKVIQLGGEVFKPSLYKQLRKYTSAEIHNGYGPSECTACSSDKLVTDENINIGRPFLNVNIFIMNKDGNILPIGYPGEIVIKGDGVGKGYINKYDFNGIYHTGDIGILSDSGELIYLGRKDNQIKLHGLRIELDEITSKIMQIPDIKNAITIIKNINNKDCICSYIQASDDKLDETKIQSILSNKLPKYMVPSHIVFVDNFSITLNGKIDTKNLPDIVTDNVDFVPCSSKTEKNIEEIWKNIFNLDKVSANISFFDLGADSLSTIRLVSEIYSKLDFKINIQDVYTYPTISELAKYLETLSSHSTSVIQKHKKADSYPVTSAQRRIFYTVNMEKDNLAYNTPFAIVFKQKPDIDKLEKCISKVLNSHDAFKTYFVLENEDVVQKMVEHIDFHLNVSNGKNDKFITPFDLSKAPLIHIELDNDNEKYILQIDIHHIICDGASIRIFAKEICDLYNGKEISLSDIDYIDYALTEKINEDDKSFWTTQFSNGIPLLNMPTEFERPNIKSFKGENVYSKFENISQIQVVQKLREAAKSIYKIKEYDLMRKACLENDGNAKAD